MSRLVLRGLLARKLRTILTSIAIVLGVAMVAGTFILTDQINAAFDDIFETGNSKIDVVVSRATEFDTFEDALPPLPESTVAEVARVDGVEHAEGQIQASGQLVVDGEIVESEGGAPAIVVSNVDESINPNVPLEGRLPENPGEIAVIKDTADKEDLEVGEGGIALATKTGTQPVSLVGIFRYGDVESIGGATVVLTTFADAQRWFDREGETSLVFASAQDGVSAAQLRDRVRGALPDTVKVETAEENAQEQSDDIAGEISGFLTPALLTFAGVALFVGAFIIFNTFSITVAQRVREFGMTRTLGATRGQVLRNVIGEALVIGVLASIIGLAVGVGIAKGIQALFDAIGFGLPAASIEIRPRTIIVALLIGVVVTVIASVGPALRATRVPPIAAVQEGATLPPGRFSRIAPYLAGVLVVLGVLLFVYGLFGDLGATDALWILAIGAVLVFLGVGMLARFVVRPLARAIGAPIEAAAGTTGRLARANATRNPARTAATAAALMIGVGLVTFVAIFAAGLKESFTGAIDRTLQGDLILQTDNFEPFPAASEQEVRERAGRRGDRVPALPGDPRRAGRDPVPEHDRPCRGRPRLRLRLAGRRVGRPLRPARHGRRPDRDQPRQVVRAADRRQLHGHHEPRQPGPLHGARRVPRPGAVHRHHGLERGRRPAGRAARPVGRRGRLRSRRRRRRRSSRRSPTASSSSSRS